MDITLDKQKGDADVPSKTTYGEVMQFKLSQPKIDDTLDDQEEDTDVAAKTDFGEAKNQLGSKDSPLCRFCKTTKSSKFYAEGTVCDFCIRKIERPLIQCQSCFLMRRPFLWYPDGFERGDVTKCDKCDRDDRARQERIDQALREQEETGTRFAYCSVCGKRDPDPCRACYQRILSREKQSRYKGDCFRCKLKKRRLAHWKHGLRG